MTEPIDQDGNSGPGTAPQHRHGDPTGAHPPPDVPVRAPDPTTVTAADAPAGAPVAPALAPPPPVGQEPIERPHWTPQPPRQPSSLEPAWLVAALIAGIAADIALRRPPWNNVGGAILVVALAAGLTTSGFIRTRTSKVMLVAACIFGVFLAVRTEPLITTCNVLASIGLLTLAAIHGQGRSFWDLRPLRLMADAVVVVFEGFNGLVEVPAEASARYRVFRERADGQPPSTVHAIIRGLAIAAPVVLVLGLLLASADAVFQSFFRGLGGLNPASLIGHLVLLTLGAYAMMVLLRLAATEAATDPIQRAPTLGAVEAGIILGSVNLLFGAFAVAQLMTVLGGAEDALDRAGLDPKQFARQGFFQLLWVAGLTLFLLMALHVATAENTSGRRPIRALALVTVALTVLIVIVALTRIVFYIDDGGQTPLRLYSAVFSVWVGAAFLVVAARIGGYRPRQAWLFPTLLVSGLVVLAGLNVANPERIIALDNIDRDHEALYWHMVEGQFTGDGQAVLATEVDRLSPDLATRVTEELCEDYERYGYRAGWLNFNLGKWRAENAVPELCATS